jgi:hypothetical protein
MIHLVGVRPCAEKVVDRVGIMIEGAPLSVAVCVPRIGASRQGALKPVERTGFARLCTVGASLGRVVVTGEIWAILSAYHRFHHEGSRSEVLGIAYNSHRSSLDFDPRDLIAASRSLPTMHA